MNREELKAYFDKPMYDDVREYAYLIMMEHPEIAEAYTIEAAACEMHDCKLNGVVLSTDNALRMVDGETPPKMEDLLRDLENAGVTSDNVRNILLSADDGEAERDKHEYSELSKDAIHKKEQLENCADFLTQNHDIVLLGIPVPVREADWMQLELGFFGKSLDAMERKALTDMKTCADSTAVFDKGNYTKVVFKIENVWVD